MITIIVIIIMFMIIIIMNIIMIMIIMIIIVMIIMIIMISIIVKAGVKLDIRPWEFLSSIAQGAAREWSAVERKREDK